MAVTTPTPTQLREVAAHLGMTLNDEEVTIYLEYLEELSPIYERLDAIPDALPEVKYPRTSGYHPTGDENKYNAWYVKTSIKGRPRGKLAGKKVAIKDSICVAGVPMMIGASVLEGYLPEIDATLVTRILDAGGEIAGKAVCECLGYSSGSHTAPTGNVENPRKKGYSTGGSSSGSAALVAAGEVDLAVGSDMAGSVRIPASHCGIYGMKATWGLVPYTGVAHYDFNTDSVGPLTATVSDNALFLEVLAGPDGIDTRHATPYPKVARYTKALDKEIKGLRIAVIEEGFRQPTSQPEVDATVREAARQFARLGATVDEVSIPWHRDGFSVLVAFENECLITMMEEGFGTNHGGLYLNSLVEKLAGWRGRADEFPHNLRVGMIAGAHARAQRGHHYYSKAMNLIPQIRAAYDAVLAEYDLLLMPTVTAKARPLPPPDASPAEVIGCALENIENTCPFNLTYHPALSAPCGMVDGLPIGMMLIGKHYDEATIYRAAYAYEQRVDWQKIAAGPRAKPRRTRRRP